MEIALALALGQQDYLASKQGRLSMGREEPASCQTELMSGLLGMLSVYKVAVNGSSLCCTHSRGAGKEVSSLVKTQQPSEADANSQENWVDVTAPLDEEAGEAADVFGAVDIPARQESREMDMDCSSVQNSPRSNSSVHDMSLDDFET